MADVVSNPTAPQSTPANVISSKPSPRSRRSKANSPPTGSSTPGRKKRRVSYFYDSEIGNFHYGFGHPMKPHRVRMTHDLIVTYGLYKHCDVFRPVLLDKNDLIKFHAPDYISFLGKHFS